MLKLILLMTILGIGFTGSSSEIPQSVKESNPYYDDSVTLVYIGCGNANLLAHNYSSALEDFQRASSSLSKTEPRPPEMEFLISFGRAIAYDNLGMREQCQNALGLLFFLLNEDQIGEEEEDSSFNGSENLLPIEYEEAGNILKQLALLAPSANVREILLSIVEEMTKELSPLFKIAEPAALGFSDWEYDYGNNAVSIDPCKSWWKRTEKLAKRTYNVIIKVKVIWDFIKDIKENLNE